MTWSLIYWAAGGTGICTMRCATVNATTTTTTTTLATTTIANNCDEIVCDKFIYPILDWDGHPGLAVLMILMGILVMPLIQTFWWACHCFRKWISNRIRK